jgi:hypothetical protein
MRSGDLFCTALLLISLQLQAVAWGSAEEDFKFKIFFFADFKALEGSLFLTGNAKHASTETTMQ